MAGHTGTLLDALPQPTSTASTTTRLDFTLHLLPQQTIGDPTRLAACLISIAAANGIGGYPRAHNHEWRRVFALVHLLFILTPGTAVHWMDH